jgi:hypothetical protein
MTVPVVGSLSRKPVWRYLPEIHATRFSVSASLRPKLGLLILLVLLALSLVLLLVPLVTLGATERKEPVSSVEPSEGVSNLILNLLSARPNPVFSPVSLLKVLHLVLSLEETSSDVGIPYLEQGLATLPDLNRNTPSFKTSIHINVSCANLAPGFAEVVRLSGATLVGPTQPLGACDVVSILSTNKLQVSIPTLQVSKEPFYVNSKLTKLIPMAVIQAEMNVSRFEDWEIIELNLNPNLVLRILLPNRVNGLGPVLNKTQGVISSGGSGVRKNVELKLPIFLAENRLSSTELESAGFRNIISGSSGIPVKETKPLPNLLHITKIELSTIGVEGVDPKLNNPEQVSCDRDFIFNILTTNLTVPLVAGIFRPAT